MERVKIKKLLKHLPLAIVKGSKEIEVTGLSSHSKSVAPGNLFIAKKGLTVDGARFIPEAIAAGAAAVITDLYDPFYPHITQIIHPDVAAIEPTIANAFYNRPAESLFLTGITGTNGKTTVSYLVRHLFESNQRPCGLIGTIEWIVGGHVYPSGKTTPDALQNLKLFYEMVEAGCQACVMEVSSHALEQGRTRGIEFDVGVFTNLTQDHLDYHRTMQAYADAKATLFRSLRQGRKSFPKVAVVNADSPYCSNMVADCPSRILRYGIENPCELMASQIQFSPDGTRCEIAFEAQRESFSSPLIGRFNVYNLLAAVGVGLTAGFSLTQIARAIATFPRVPGRLERVPNPLGLSIFVDYAHTEDALLNVLKTLKELKPNRLLTVFGCGGSRDADKRPMMGAAAETLSDCVIVTSDNPRKEDPDQIIREILSGLKRPSQAIVLPDREEAIRRAVQLATPHDIVLIAGKGHEDYQIFSDRTIAFDDRLAAQKACTLLP
jgi:UDP-N-acetylmuramoyl-L-alanyl-D-glutamate--2,6-diaminopimelate ligase